MSRIVIALTVLLGGATATAGPVIVVGADGMTFDVIEPMVRGGKLPTFARLLEQGARADLRSERPMRSPALWTTIATGQPRKVHRVFDFVTGSDYWPRKERHDNPSLVTSDMREASALWQWATQAKMRSVVVGWLNTWPAEAIDGVMVAPYVALGSRKQTSIKGRIYDDASRQTHPPEAFQNLRRHVVDTKAVGRDLVRTMIDEPTADSPLYKKYPRLKRYLYTVRWSIASTLTNTNILVDQLQAADTKLAMTYFDGSDTLAHRFWLLRQPVADVEARLRAHNLDPAHAAELKQRFGKALDGYYELVDQQLAAIWKAAGPEATLMVISDHGWGPFRGGDRAPHAHVPFDGEHRLDGIFLAAGPALQAGTYNTLTLYDVAPTVAYLMGIQPPTALPGRIAKEIMRPGFINGRQLTLLSAEDPTRQKPKPTQTPFEAQEMERLRSLGYVQ